MTRGARCLRLAAVAGFLAVAIVSGFPAPSWALGEETIEEVKKAPVDAGVRAEMARIRDLTRDVHTLVTHRRMPPAEARKFHASVKEAVLRIDAAATLIGAPREKLTAVTQDLVAGAAAVAGLDKSLDPIDGIVLIDDALARYADFFDHPDWQPLR